MEYYKERMAESSSKNNARVNDKKKRIPVTSVAQYACACLFVIGVAYVRIYNSNVEDVFRSDGTSISRSSSVYDGILRVSDGWLGKTGVRDDNVVISRDDKSQTEGTKRSGSDSEGMLTKRVHANDIKDEKPRVKNIALLGERHSGTNWITSELQKCFPTINVSPRLQKYKHWFQTNATTTGAVPNSQKNQKRRQHAPTLVIAPFRNVYEWTEAMRLVPHHSPNHLYLPWKEFVTKPWTMPRPRRDLEIKDKASAVCQHGFRYREVVPCIEGTRDDDEYLALKKKINRTMFSGHEPIYELRPRDDDGGGGEEGGAYESILELRAAKIENYLSVGDWDWVERVISVQYEELVKNGTDSFLREIERTVGVQRHCRAAPPQKRKQRVLEQDFEDWITDHTNWKAESLIGYKKWDEEKNDGATK